MIISASYRPFKNHRMCVDICCGKPIPYADKTGILYFLTPFSAPNLFTIKNFGMLDVTIFEPRKLPASAGGGIGSIIKINEFLVK